jgi:hypothetical protein
MKILISEEDYPRKNAFSYFYVDVFLLLRDRKGQKTIKTGN